MFDSSKPKHHVLRSLLVELGVDDPEYSGYYSTGSTITAAGIEAAKKKVIELKEKIRRVKMDVTELP